uniref:Putative DNA primase n=1 Tax=Closterium baillyanum TaxID=1416941 RepID=A0A191T5Z2_9VIRI|nr:putative DNA primase [Closterium baillyanum]YP_009256845.1 putative DNA primase [Closterium baillyanum]ANI25814.1 putative DNA primase [Closterium baillyanum]ANI25815.1 putative DNA primase [Closterium baillyanum]
MFTYSLPPPTKVWDLRHRDSQRKFGTIGIGIDYSFDAYPDATLRNLLLNFVGGDARMLNILRGAVRRVLEPSDLFQTGIWLVGPPASGKSTLINWVRFVLEDRCVEINCNRTSMFDRANRAPTVLVSVREN